MSKSLSFNVFCFISLLSFIAFLSFGCNFDLITQPTPDTVSVYRHVPPLLALPQYVALQKGFFSENNLHIVEADSEQDKNNLTINLVDSSYLSADNSSQVLFMQLARGDLALVGRQQDTDAFTLAKIKKHSIISFSRESWPTRRLLYGLSTITLRPFIDFSLLYNIPEPLTTSAFVSGTGDYLEATYHEGYRLEKNGQGYVVALLDDILGNTLGAGYTIAPEAYTEKKALLQKFVNSVYKAQLWMNQHSDKEIVETVAKVMSDYSTEELEELIRCYRQKSILTKNPIPAPSIAKAINEVATPREYNNSKWMGTIDDHLAVEAIKSVKLQPPNQDEKKRIID